MVEVKASDGAQAPLRTTEGIKSALEFFKQRPGDVVFLGRTFDGKIVGVRTVKDNNHKHWGFVFDSRIPQGATEPDFIEATISIETWGRNNATAFFPSPTDKRYFDEYVTLPYEEFINKASADGVPPEDVAAMQFYRMTEGYEIPSDKTQQPLVGSKELLPLDHLE